MRHNQDKIQKTESGCLRSMKLVRIILAVFFMLFIGAAIFCGAFLFKSDKGNEPVHALTGDGSQGNPYKISTPEDLTSLASNVNAGTTYKDKYFEMENDIDLKGKIWVPIGSTAPSGYGKNFQGHFDGKNHTIYNMNVTQTASYKGLFGCAYNATFENVTIENPVFATTAGALAGGEYTGAIVGRLVLASVSKVDYNSYVKNCHLKNGQLLSSGSYVGGLVGRVTAPSGNTFKMENCTVTGGVIKGNNYVGGLIGYLDGAKAGDLGKKDAQATIIENCTVKGSGTNKVPTYIFGASSNVGGIIGYATSTAYTIDAGGTERAGVYVSKCASTATVVAKSDSAGGICGYAAGVKIDQCYNTGAVSNILGNYTGGICGIIMTAAVRVENCLSMGDVSASNHSTAGAQAGGIAGDVKIAGSSIEKCVVTGNILASPSSSGNGWAGGIVGLGETSVAVGGCVVASEHISGQTSSSGASLSSPFVCANNVTATVLPTTIKDLDVNLNNNRSPIDAPYNYYNADMILGARKANSATGNYPAWASNVSGVPVSLSEMTTTRSIYDHLKWDFTSGVRVWNHSSSQNEGIPYLDSLGEPEKPYGHKTNPIEIQTAADFYDLRTKVNASAAADRYLYAAQYLKQTADLDLSAMTEANIIGSTNEYSFRGNYDGGNHRLLNVDFTTKKGNTAIFGVVLNASFRNVVVESPKVFVTGKVSNVGILVALAYNNLYMENCAIIGGQLIAQQATNVGALCANDTAGGNHFIRCFSSASVDGGTNVGGLVGNAFGTRIERCYTSGNVKSTTLTGVNLYVGGLVGQMSHATNTAYLLYEYDYTKSENDPKGSTIKDNSGCTVVGSTIKDSYAKCDVTVSLSGNYNITAGGILGYAYGKTTVSNCYFNGNLSATATGGSAANTSGAFAGGIIGMSFYGDVAIDHCLSAIQKVTASSTRGYLGVGYFNTYYIPFVSSGTAAAPVKPHESEDSYYIEVSMPSVSNAAGINTGTKITLNKADDGNGLLAVTDGSVFKADALGWNMSTVWERSNAVNDGFPMLKGLIIDSIELVQVLNRAQEYQASDWSEETFGHLQDLITAAREEMVKNTLTNASQEEYITDINNAIDSLRADKKDLKNYYDIVIREIAPNADFYTNYSMVDSVMKSAQTIVEDNTSRYRNGDVKTIYDALVLAVNSLRVDKTELNKAVEQANAIMLKPDSYLAADVLALKNVLDKAVEVNNNPSASVDDVIAATKAMQAALEKMKLDKSKLIDAIIGAYNSIGVKAEYIELSSTFKLNEEDRLDSKKLENYDAFEKALNAAVAVTKKADATSKEISTAVFNLNVALNDLALNKKTLQNLCSEAASSLLNESYYTKSSVEALKTAYAAAQTELKLSVTKDNLIERSEALDKATQDLDSAISALGLDKSELEQLLKWTEDELKEDIYTGDSLKALQNAYDNGKKVFDSTSATQEDIRNAVTALDDAIQNLTINLAHLKSLIDEATAILDNDNSKLYSNLDALQDARDKAQPVYNDYNGGQSSEENTVKIQKVKNATKALQTALDNLSVSTKELNDYVTWGTSQTNQNYVNDIVYTPESAKAFRDAAQEVKDKGVLMLTKEEVITYTLKLRALYNALKPNKDALTKLVAEVNVMTNTKYRQDNDGKWILDDDGNMKVFVIYSQDTWDKLQDELKKANDVILDNDATVDEVTEARTNLIAARDKLVVDTSELEERMKKAEGLLAQTDIYTATSLTALQTAYDEADKLLKGSGLTLESVQEKLDALLAAINGLKADLTALQNRINEGNNLLKQYGAYYSTASANKLQSVIDQATELIKTDLDTGSVTLLVNLINSAIDGLVIVTDGLKDLIKDFNALEKDFITDATYNAAKTAADAARNLLKGTIKVDEYASAFTALKSALNGIKPDMAKYKAFIAECEKETKRSCTDESKAALQAVIDSAKEISTDTDSTYDDVIASVHALQAAVDALVPTKDGLADLIKATQEYLSTAVPELGDNVTYADCFTEDSYAVLNAALQKGIKINDAGDASLDEVEDAMAAITNAKDALVLDRSLLQYLIKECDENYGADYADYFEVSSYMAFTTQLTASKTVVAKANLTIDEYAKSYEALLNARNALEFDTSALDKIIARAEEKVTEQQTSLKYSAASFKTLTDNLQTAKTYRDNTNRDPSQSNGVCSNLLAAISGLVDISKLDPAISTVQAFVNKGNNISNGHYYSSGSFKALQDLLARAIALKTGNPTQSEVDYVVDKLTNYEDVLLDVTDDKQYSIEQHTFMGREKYKYTEASWAPYAEAVEKFDELIELAKHEVTREEIAAARAAVKAAYDNLKEDPDATLGLFQVIEKNKTFQFIDGEGNAVNFGEHVYDANKPTYLTNIALGDSISDILAQFVNEGIKVYDSKGVEITNLSQVIATGMVLEILDGNTVIDAITLVIRGDVDGNGEIDVFDKAQLNAYTNGNAPIFAGLSVKGAAN